MKLVAVVTDHTDDKKVAFRTEPPLSQEVLKNLKARFGAGAPDLKLFGNFLLVPVSMTLTVSNWRRFVEEQLTESEKAVEKEVELKVKEAQAFRDHLEKTYGLPLE